MQDRSPTVSFAGHTRTPSTHILLPKGNLESSISQSFFGLGRNQKMHRRETQREICTGMKGPKQVFKSRWVMCTDLYFQYPSLWARKLPYMSKWVVWHYCGSQKYSPNVGKSVFVWVRGKMVGRTDGSKWTEVWSLKVSLCALYSCLFKIIKELQMNQCKKDKKTNSQRCLL